MELIFIILFPALFAAAGIYDFLHQKIPNKLNFAIILIAFVYQTIIFGMPGIISATIGLILGIAILFVPFALGGMGAGDVKMMGAVGAALGPQGVVVSFLYTALLGGLWASLILLVSKDKKAMTRLATDIKAMALTLRLDFQLEKRKKSSQLCYGVVIAAGAIIYIFLEFWQVQLISL